MAKSREQLEATSVKDLREIAASYDIEGRSQLDKAGLVDAIEAAQSGGTGSSAPTTTSGKLHSSADAIRDDVPQGPSAEGEGPVVGFATKAAAPAPAHVPGETVDPRRHVPHTAPPAPTRFDGRDSGAQQ
jgi:hypothetical protein